MSAVKYGRDALDFIEALEAHTKRAAEVIRRATKL
jgi:hypothetical protein